MMVRRAVRRVRRAATAVPVALGVLLAAVGPAGAQMDAPEVPEATGGGGSGLCLEINSRAYEAAMVIRQHASALSVGFEPDARPQALQMLAWMDQWIGRLRMLVDLGDGSQCLDDGDAETYRRALAVAFRVGNQVREEILRPARPPQQAPRPRR
jgi:hypothetical protein